MRSVHDMMNYGVHEISTRLKYTLLLSQITHQLQILYIVVPVNFYIVHYFIGAIAVVRFQQRVAGFCYRKEP